MTVVSYQLEHAKSSRSKCKTCKSGIQKNALRFGSRRDATTSWFCIDCVSMKQLQSAESAHGSLEDIPGVSSLPDDDKREVLSKLKNRVAGGEAGEKSAAPVKRKAEVVFAEGESHKETKVTESAAPVAGESGEPEPAEA
ncbi:PARP-type domain-containing protein [Plasmodiophora brassicae]|uniref:PARP-type domain-containing protein n=1 Tax=Plasmodiophora brassicae TaxID=37360 RepID=A0A0G4J698_PLABS|nr:hypothetical protein PBRA_002876 [Plasmodiophora brassicae]SPQ95013.1 unnamed protein product [Plasmodiophora brassicae]